MPELWLPPEYRKPKPGQNAAGVTETMVYYLRDRDGHMIIPPRNDQRAPAGYKRVECKTVAQITAASRKFAAQKQREFDRGDVNYHMRQEQFMNEKIANLQRRLASGQCGNFERDFIHRAIEKIREDVRKHKIKRELYLHMEAHEAPLKA